MERLLKERIWCEACQVFNTHDKKTKRLSKVAIDAHEVISRGRSGSIVDETNILVVCREPCHRKITDNPKLAEKLGLALPSSWAGMSQKEMLAVAASIRLSWINGQPVTAPWIV